MTCVLSKFEFNVLETILFDHPLHAMPCRTLPSDKGGTEDEKSLLTTVIEGALEQLGSLIDAGMVGKEDAATLELEGGLKRLKKSLQLI